MSLKRVFETVGTMAALCAVGLAADQSVCINKSLKSSYGVLANGTVIGVGRLPWWEFPTMTGTGR
jgi:hypothetical protein